MKWGQAVYELNGPFCCIKAFRGQVKLGFWRGNQLADPKGLLEKSVDRMRYIKLAEGERIQHPQFRELLKLAVKLNRQFGDPTGQRAAHFYQAPQQTE